MSDVEAREAHERFVALKRTGWRLLIAAQGVLEDSGDPVAAEIAAEIGRWRESMKLSGIEIVSVLDELGDREKCC